VPCGATLLRQLPLAGAQVMEGHDAGRRSRVASAPSGGHAVRTTIGSLVRSVPNSWPLIPEAARSRPQGPGRHGPPSPSVRVPCPTCHLLDPEKTAPDPAETYRFGGFAENGFIRARSVGSPRDSMSRGRNTQRTRSAHGWSAGQERGAGQLPRTWRRHPTGGFPVVLGVDARLLDVLETGPESALGSEAQGGFWAVLRCGS